MLSNLESNKAALSVNLAIILVFNFVDIKQHITREMDNFDNVLRVDDKCNRISEFVDRLLPRHVFYCHQDPRDNHAGRVSIRHI